ncbi:MAG: tetratricopeptide repeat protein, partial [Sphingomonadales bacterium]|nr:tetratricopeptide repeat protein [Sphingomonadales bacterium]
AVLAARAGNVNLARRLLVKAGPDLDGVPAAILVKGAMELEAGNANAALAQFERLTQMQPANPRVQLLLARALYESGNTDGLIARFSGSATRPDASPYLLALLARAFEDKGDRLAAAQLLDRVAEAHALPVMPIAEHGGVDAAATIRVQIAAGNINGAAASAQRYVDDHPGSFEAQSLAGDAALAQGVALPALQHYALAARVRFSDRIVLRSVEALERSGQGRAAPAFVVGYFNAFPGSRAAARLAAGHAAYAGDWSHARSLLESLRERGGNRDARLLVDLSLAQLRTGDADAAEETAQRAVDLSPASGVAAQAWGMALVELDRDPDRARQLLTKARRIDGDNPLLAQAFAKLGK